MRRSLLLTLALACAAAAGETGGVLINTPGSWHFSNGASLTISKKPNGKIWTDWKNPPGLGGAQRENQWPEGWLMYVECNGPTNFTWTYVGGSLSFAMWYPGCNGCNQLYGVTKADREKSEFKQSLQRSPWLTNCIIEFSTCPGELRKALPASVLQKYFGN